MCRCGKRRHRALCKLRRAATAAPPNARRPVCVAIIEQERGTTQQRRVRKANVAQAVQLISTAIAAAILIFIANEPDFDGLEELLFA
jgi:hypothetical protein